MSAYLRELSHAERDMQEALDLLRGRAGGAELTIKQLATATGLADTAHRALLAAMKARHTKGPQA